jgi:hypothetical protein
MKKTLTALLLIASLSAKSQTRLGSTESEIKSEFNDKTFLTYYTKSGNRVIYYRDADKEVGYLFEKTKSYCTLCTIQPLKQGMLNYYAEKFNKDYVIVDETHWKWYNNSSVVNISLIQEGSYSYFLFQE